MCWFDRYYGGCDLYEKMKKPETKSGPVRLLLGPAKKKIADYLPMAKPANQLTIWRSAAVWCPRLWERRPKAVFIEILDPRLLNERRGERDWNA